MTWEVLVTFTNPEHFNLLKMTKMEMKNLDKLEYARKIYSDAYDEIMNIDEKSDSKDYHAKLEEIKSKTKAADSILKEAARELNELKKASQKTLTFHTDVKVIHDGEIKVIKLKD